MIYGAFQVILLQVSDEGLEPSSILKSDLWNKIIASEKIFLKIRYRKLETLQSLSLIFLKFAACLICKKVWVKFQKQKIVNNIKYCEIFSVN